MLYTFLEGKLLRLVPRDTSDGSLFFVSEDGTIGYNYSRSGLWKKIKATPTTCINSKDKTDAKRKQRYLQFKNALGRGKHILVSHAVYLAWVGEIPKGYVVDHLNGITTDNRAANLDPVTFKENAKRAKLLQVLRSIGRNPLRLTRVELLTIFSRYEFRNPSDIMEYELTHHMEF